MPPGVVPDELDGSAWVGLIGLRMPGAALGRGPGIPYFGTQLTHLKDLLVAAAGINVAGPPESVLFSPGVSTRFNRPWFLDEGS